MIDPSKTLTPPLTARDKLLGLGFKRHRVLLTALIILSVLR